MNKLIVSKGKDQITKSFSLCCLVVLQKATSVFYSDHVRKGAIPLYRTITVSVRFTEIIKKLNK